MCFSHVETFSADCSRADHYTQMSLLSCSPSSRCHPPSLLTTQHPLIQPSTPSFLSSRMPPSRPPSSSATSSAVHTWSWLGKLNAQQTFLKAEGTYKSQPTKSENKMQPVATQTLPLQSSESNRSCSICFEVRKSLRGCLLLALKPGKALLGGGQKWHRKTSDRR
jgi:hypothetical protein